MALLSVQLRNRLGLLKSYVLRQSHVPGGPLTLAIESTAKCNLFCPMCPRESIYFPPKDMELPVFKKIIDDGKAFLEFAVPYGVGEPLLNPEIYDMIAYCKQVGVPSGISTNATVLTEEAGRKLIKAGLDYIILAFDGATKATYEKYRKGADFEKVRANIGFLSTATALYGRLTAREFIEYFARLNGMTESHLKQRIDSLIQTLGISVEGIDEIRIKKDEVHNEGSAIPGDSEERPPMKHPCYLLWRGPMYIHYDGTVFPCCYIYPEEPIGNVRKSTLQEIWNSDKMVQLREAHIRGDLRGYKACQNCPAARPKLPVTLGSFLINTHTVRKTIPFFERLAQLRNISVFETLK